MDETELTGFIVFGVIAILLGAVMWYDTTPEGKAEYRAYIARGQEQCANHGGLDYAAGGGKTRRRYVCNDGTRFRAYR